jgi:hypothetical protein
VGLRGCGARRFVLFGAAGWLSGGGPVRFVSGGMGYGWSLESEFSSVQFSGVGLGPSKLRVRTVV